jgi:hypothetical protein
MILYFGKTFTSSQSGTKLVEVVCDKCRTHYQYELARIGVGQGSAPYFMFQEKAKRRAELKAQKNLQRRLETQHEMVPCPRCNWVNEEMVENFRRQKWTKGGAASMIVMLTLYGGLVVIGIAIVMAFQRTQHMGQICLCLIVGAFVLSCIITILRGQSIRSQINPNLTYPKRPVLPPGTPPALIESGEEEDGSVIFEPVPSGVQNVGDPEWVVFRAGHIVFPATCCECMEPAKTAYKSPFRINENDRDVAVPLCESCARKLRRRWWAAAVGTMSFFEIVSVVTGKLNPRDPSLPMLMAIPGFLLGVIAIAIIPNMICRPYRIRSVDAARGIVGMFFRNRSFTDLLNERVRAADGVV